MLVVGWRMTLDFSRLWWLVVGWLGPLLPPLLPLHPRLLQNRQNNVKNLRLNLIRKRFNLRPIILLNPLVFFYKRHEIARRFLPFKNFEHPLADVPGLVENKTISSTNFTDTDKDVNIPRAKRSYRFKR